MLKTTIPYQADTFLVVQERSRILGVIPMVEGEEDYAKIIAQIIQEHYSALSVSLDSAIHKDEDNEWEYGGKYIDFGDLQFDVTVNVSKVHMYGKLPETRVYGIDVELNEREDYIPNMSDLDFILEANYVWTLKDFQIAYNEEKMNFSNIFIRFIFSK